MADEFTTEMHFELMSEEMSELDFKIMATYAKFELAKKKKTYSKSTSLAKKPTKIT